MQRVSAGDRCAFRVIVERHQAAVYALAFRHLGTRAEAEDVTQETFVRLFGAAGRYESRGRLRSYVLRIAANLALNRRARHQRRFERSLDEAGSVALASEITGNPETHADERQRVSAIREAIAALPEDQRMVVLLTRFEELSYAEVARVLDKSVGAVTSLLWRARKELRARLAPPAPDLAQGSCSPPVRTKGSPT